MGFVKDNVMARAFIVCETSQWLVMEKERITVVQTHLLCMDHQCLLAVGY